MKAARGGAEFQRLVRVWMDWGYSRRESERLAREDQRVSAVWRDQGMSQADVNRALAKLRSIRDLFVVDRRGRLRPMPAGPSIADLKRKNRS
jgi:hypothetical protein